MARIKGIQMTELELRDAIKEMADRMARRGKVEWHQGRLPPLDDAHISLDEVGKGSSDVLNGNLWHAFGLPKPNDVAGHHLIPIKVAQDPDLIGFFYRLRFNLDHAKNGTILPTLAKSEGAFAKQTQHAGRHKGYSEAVKGHLKTMKEAFDKEVAALGFPTDSKTWTSAQCEAYQTVVRKYQQKIEKLQVALRDQLQHPGLDTDLRLVANSDPNGGNQGKYQEAWKQFLEKLP
jgi:hypothetical protein